MGDALLEAILTGGCVSGAAAVLHGGPVQAVPGKLLPPMLVASNEMDWDDGAYFAVLKQIEHLSLAARLALMGSEAHPALKADIGAFPTIEAGDLIAAVSSAAALAAGGSAQQKFGAESSPAPIDSLRLRHGPRPGLQVVGCRIHGDVDFTNANLPFSLRLVGCVIEGSVIVNHCALTSLDLCGSAVKGVYATSLTARGSVRLRRTFSTGPMDFGGADVRGLFDATECVVFPRDDPPGGQGFAGDRGVFNLALATLENEMGLRRGRIYGGLALRGTSIARSLFMDESVIYAPLALLEALALKEPPFIDGDDEARRDKLLARYDALLKRDGEDDGPGVNTTEIGGRRLQLPLIPARLPFALLPCPPKPPPEPMQALIALAPIIRAVHPVDDRNAIDGALRRRAEERTRMKAACQPKWVWKGEKDRPRRRGDVPMAAYEAAEYAELQWLDAARISPTLDRLVGESFRSRTCAIRGDGFQIKGTIFGDRLIGHGRVRLKYAIIGGGLHLSGAEIRSPGAVRRNLERLERFDGNRESKRLGKKGIFSTWRRTFEALDRRAPGKVDGYALDIREAKIEGDVRLNALSEPSPKAKDEDRPEPAERVKRPTRLWGMLAAGPVRIGGNLELIGLVFEPFGPHAKNENPIRVSLDQAHIGGDVDLSSALGVRGVNARQVRIEGHLTFFRHRGWEDQPRQPLKRVCAVEGKIDFTSARIDGDASFAFDPDSEQQLDLSLSRVGGRLQILPATGNVRIERKRYDENNKRAISDRKDLTGKNEKKKKAAQEKISRGDLASIHLTNARAVVFCHPPSAWPRQNRLHIEGLYYESATEEGPLNPFPIDDAQGRPRRLWIPALPEKGAEPLDWIERLFVFAAFIAALVATLLATMAVIPKAAAAFPHFAPWGEFISVIEAAGPENALIFLFLLLIYSGLNVLKAPHKKMAEPMAIHWLARQKAQPNRFKFNSYYWPLYPYLEASRILRAAGRSLAAGWVERERLRERRKLLSKRYHPAPKLFLAIVDMVAEYGFNPSRTLFLTLFLIAAGAMVFQQGHDCGAIALSQKTPGEAEESLPAGRLSESQPIPLLKPAEPLKPLQKPQGAATLPPDFSGAPRPIAPRKPFELLEAFFLATDTVLPLPSFGEAQRWNIGACTDAMASSRGMFNAFPLWTRWFLRFFGLMLTSIFLAALGARAEVWFTRTGD